MSDQDLHKRFSTECFNDVWELLSRNSRTADEDRLMREMAHASLFHWLKREDHCPLNISIGYWQISRVYSILEDGSTALFYGSECLKISEGLPPFHLSYAHEAIARACMIRGDVARQLDHHKQATMYFDQVTDDPNIEYLKADLDEVAPQLS